MLQQLTQFSTEILMTKFKLIAAALAMLVPAAAFAADAGCCCGADKACCKGGADCCDKMKAKPGDPKPAPMPDMKH
jgi:hypothetical protein